MSTSFDNSSSSDDGNVSQLMMPSNYLSTKVLIFDWDDTIFPSSWLFSLQDYELAKDKIRRLENSAIELFKTVKQLGLNVMIITNADLNWVHQSCIHYMPKLYPYIQDLTIVSARDRQSQFHTDSGLWKQYTFDDEIRKVWCDRQRSHLSLISIGDSLYERNAVMEFERKHHNVCVKSIKMMDRPSLSQLVKQQELIARELGSMVSRPERMDLKLAVQYD